MLAGMASIVLLQKTFPSYGGGFSLTNFVVDAGIFMLFTGGATLLSLNEVDSIVEPIKKQWILEHNLGYLRKMRELQRTFQIGLLSQIERYVPTEERSNWKDKYDGCFL
jgi:hypothetical protein